jgi:hypothetical protein
MDLMIEQEESLEDFLTGIGMYGIADPIIFWEVVDLIEVMTKIDGKTPSLGILMPAVGF